ncbi:MAG: alpha/beta hydrolase [Zoogloea sp.]|jgi:pimeloyl-ACP methyl ester carboxylesterase|uniref:alpha/beta fold hydrolase n=1 Tax=Zoogloea sp. TaxID=49181 RepID=UPI0026370CCD|nr:alpha/beta hydrolase [Zoogloea sp.]MDD3326133.1 alpha/beta hydrolase [Zoogloea sp.]
MDHFTADDGEKIHLKISGDGPPLVLLHGWTSTHRDWNPFIDAFAQHFRVYRWDARGHGGHPLKGSSAPTAQRMARDLQNLLDHYRLDQAVAVGHSMGALTLWQYLRDFGDSRLSRLVFIDQSPRLLTGDGWQGGIYGDFGPERSASFMAELRHDFAEAVLRLVAFGHNPRARELYQQNGPGIQLARERLRALDPQPLIDCWASLTAADYRDVLARITIPALLVYGGASNFYSAGTAQYVRDSIPNAVLHTYPDVDHAPHLWERERFVGDVLSFVAGGAHG